MPTGPTACSPGPHPHAERLVERLPAGRRQGRAGQRVRQAACSNGWQLSGISSLASGIPIRLELHRRRRGQRASPPPTSAPPTSSGRATPAATRWRRSTPAIRRCRATARSARRSSNLNCIGVPAFGQNGDLVPPYNIRTPTRMNHDLTVFKNFATVGDQKLQVRVGFFNIFNQAFANTNIGGRHQPDAGHGVQRSGGQRAERHRRHGRQRLRPDRRVRLHAADEGQLRQDQPASAATASSSSS